MISSSYWFVRGKNILGNGPWQVGGEREERENLGLQDAIFLNINILMKFDARCVLVHLGRYI